MRLMDMIVTRSGNKKAGFWVSRVKASELLGIFTETNQYSDTRIERTALSYQERSATN